MNNWILTIECSPPNGVEVIGYNRDWIDDDFNPNGTRICFVNDQGIWTVARWCNSQDSWYTETSDENLVDGKPTHWRKMPRHP